jgi:DNA polymerase-1
MKCIIDIETDSLTPSRIWCVVCREVATNKVHTFLNLDSDQKEREKFHEFQKTVSLWIAHNGVGFDLPVLVAFGLVPASSLARCVDTLVVSRTVDYNIEGGHSLDAWGKRLGARKSSFHDFSQLTQEMVDYCVQDTLVTLRLFNRFKPVIFNAKWAKALRVEHDMVVICNDMKTNGFYFEIDKARGFMADIEKEMGAIEKEFQDLFPPQLAEVEPIKYTVTAKGGENHHVRKSRETYPLVQVDGGFLRRYVYSSFDPASPKDRIDRMWEAGWEPTSRTKGHIEHLRQGKNRDVSKDVKFNRYGWKMNEENLATLPDTAPEGARKLAMWVTLQGRKLILKQWLDAYNERTHRLHGSFLHIGSWTGRMSHNDPNSANIFSPFHGEPKSAVEVVKKKFDGPLRATWSVPKGKFLVGTDAEGIQLRILAHTLGNKAYALAIDQGKKEDKTDIHNVNMRSLNGNSFVCRDRDTAKTFIYAFLLGAGVDKVASILSCSKAEATEAVERFMLSTEGLYELKKTRIPAMADRGGFVGVDGRFVKCSSSHLMLAGILQNGEACVMKHANILWRKEADLLGIRYKQVNFVHDEWQTEVETMEEAELLGAVQRKSIEDVGVTLGILCPLRGSTDIGTNWMEIGRAHV